ncbi:hypothetical protein DN34_3229 [Vibrio cholerae]|nr:hypothetical protein DN34_3229 [Vibrio cholerae]
MKKGTLRCLFYWSIFYIHLRSGNHRLKTSVLLSTRRYSKAIRN